MKPQHEHQDTYDETVSYSIYKSLISFSHNYRIERRNRLVNYICRNVTNPRESERCVSNLPSSGYVIAKQHHKFFVAFGEVELRYLAKTVHLYSIMLFIHDSTCDWIQV
jgi:hypothetical protein